MDNGRTEQNPVEAILKELQAIRLGIEQLVPLLSKIAGEIDSVHIQDGAPVSPDEERDELYEDARKAVLRADKASTSYLQRILGIGYARAAKLIDMLEENGVIGPAMGAAPRRVIRKLTPEVLKTLATIEQQLKKKKK